MATKIGTTARNAAADGIVDRVDDGASAGYIQVRTGAAPTNPGDANSGTLLATLPMSDPAFGAASAGVATASAITNDSSADASGTAGHFRVFDSNNVCHIQGNCAEGSGGEMNFDDADIVAGGVVAVTSFTLTQPASS